MQFPTSIVTRQVLSIDVDGEPWKLAPASVADVQGLIEYEKSPEATVQTRSLYLLWACVQQATGPVELPEFVARVAKLTQPAIGQLFSVAWKLTFPPKDDSPKAEETGSPSPS